MACSGCQRIRRVIGIKRRVGVDGVNPDRGLFADGLTIPQKMLHISAALVILSIGAWLMWLAIWGTVAMAEWTALLLAWPSA